MINEKTLVLDHLKQEEYNLAPEHDLIMINRNDLRLLLAIAEAAENLDTVVDRYESEDCVWQDVLQAQVAFRKAGVIE